jgi:type IX secretion system PorP/SprF family membrane protein
MKQNLPDNKNLVPNRGWVLTMLIKPYSLLLFVLLSTQLYSQQIPVYSAYFFNKYLINPGFTGIDNEYRAFGFYRTQWGALPGHPNTGGATAEASLWKDQIGIGGYVVNDKIGIFNTVNAALSYAQKFRFAKDHQISIGIQGGIFTNRIDFSNATTADLNDPGLLDQKPSKTVFDMSLGLGYKWKELLVGFSVPNLLQPLAQYATPGMAANYEYVRHYTAFAQYRIVLLDGKFNITPQLFMRKGPASGFQFDATAMFDYKSIVFIGGGYRNSFGVIGMAGVNILNMFTIAYAYDYTTQPAIKGQVGSTHEITAGFHIPSHFKTKKYYEAKIQIEKDSLAKAQKDNADLTAKADSTQQALDSTLAQIKALQAAYDSLKNATGDQREVADSLAKKLDQLTRLINVQEQSEERKHPLPRPVGKGEQMQAQKTANEQLQEQDISASKPQTMTGKYQKPEAVQGQVLHVKPGDYKKIADNMAKETDEVLATKSLTPEQSLKGNSYRLERIYFDYNKYTLQPKSRKQLDDLTAFMKRFPNIHILIIGYTDNTGNDQGNEKLSMDRSQSVADYLINKGIESSRLEFQGLGSRYPIADNSNEDGRHLNRRVEFTIVKE